MSDQPKKVWTPLPADAIASLGWVLGIPGIAVLTGMLLPRLCAARVRGDNGLFICAVAVVAVGTICLAAAKFPLWRRRRFTSFGPSELTGLHRTVYWLACALLLLGAFLLGLLVVAVHSG